MESKLIFDFIDNDHGDIRIENGDLLLAASTDQHVKDILDARMGDYRQSPLIGLDLEQRLELSQDPALIRQEIEEHLRLDKLKVNHIDLVNKKIDATY